MRGITAFLLCLSPLHFATAESNELATAKKIDQVLESHFERDKIQPAPLANDEDFLRRISLDLIGTVPSAKDVTLFGLNPISSKRSERIDELLDQPEFAKLWGSYWLDVVMSRATEQRARIVEPAFEAWLVEQFEGNRPWDEITRELLTATGSVRETGETGLIFAHTGEPQELAAEVSRIFLGIQMSCANCHDHPTDSWKREDFHQLAAFLPRIRVRREEPGNPTSWAVRSLEQSQRRRGNINLDAVFRGLDRNRDGQLAKSEARGQLASRFDQILQVGDADKNGRLSKQEFESVRSRANNQQPGQGELEYYMPDLNNPAAKGRLTQPVFFISETKGPRLRENADDLTRRHALADYITSPTNPWFAKAFVNRVWSELLGQGFYTPIDDMGPERFPLYEDALEILANGFVESGYDVKWVYRTIANTTAYQRQMQQTPADEYVPPFASAAPTRLRSDQIYQALFDVLGTTPGGSRFGRFRGGMMNYRLGLDPAKRAFDQTFGVDPSTPQDDIIGNVPQALFMMNSSQLEQNIRGTGNTRLATLLRNFDDDGDALHELYLMVLSREPTEKELKINQEFIAEVGNRTESFEDIMWSLLNSTEFLSKR